MILPVRFTAIIFFGFLAGATGCATVSGPHPDTRPGLPEGHPEIGEVRVFQHDATVEAYAAFLNGMLLERDGKFEEAINSFEAAARLDTGSVTPLIEIMALQMEMGRIEEAEKTGKRALGVSEDLGQVHIALGQMFLDSGRINEALDHLLKGTGLEPDNTGALFPLAEAMEKSGDREGALAVLEKLTVEEEFEALARFHIARLLILSGQIPESVDHFSRAIELNPSFIRALGDQGTQLEKSGKPESAIQLYQAFLEKNPENRAVRGFLAKTYFITDQISQARTQLDLILKEDPENLTGLLLLGLVESRKENYARALELFNHLRTVSGDSFDTLMQIGSTQREMKMYPEAAATFEETARIYPDRFEPHLNLAIIHDAEGDMEKAQSSAEKALSLAPDRSSIRTYLAQILTRQERFSEAITLLEEGLEIDPEDVALLYQMGITHDQAGRFDLAEKALLLLLEVKSNHPDALNYLGYSWADRGIRLEEAKEMIEKALRIRPDAPYIIDSLGWVHYQLGHYEEALRLLLIAVEKMEEDPTVLDHLGDTYEKLGQEELAILYWSRALASDPDNPEIARKLKGKGVDTPLP